MERNCSECNQPIPDGRLKALPKTLTCTACSTTNKVAGHALITGKTEYSALQIVDQETAINLSKIQNRKGYGVSNGVKFDFDIKRQSNGI